MKKVFAIIMSAMMLVCFMPTMAFATGGDAQTSFIANKPAAERDWDSVGKFRVELSTPAYAEKNLEAATAYAEVYKDYSVYAKLDNDKVNGHSVQATIAMRDVASLGCAGTKKSHTVGPITANLDAHFTLKNYFPNIMNFKSAKISGSVNENEFVYNVSDFAVTPENSKERVLTATPDSTENVRAAWFALTDKVVTSTFGEDDSKIFIPAGAYLQIGTEKLTFKADCTIDPSKSGVEGTENDIRVAAELATGVEPAPAPTNIVLYVPAGSKLRVGASMATLKNALQITSNLSGDTMKITLDKLRSDKTDEGTVSLDLIKDLFGFVDGIFGAVSGNQNVSIDVLSEHIVKYGTNEAKVLYGKTFTLPPADSGKKWVDADQKEVKAGDIRVTKDMVLTQAESGTSGGGGGGAFVVIPTETPLDKAKTEANTAISAAASANKYDDAEQAEVKAILDKAAADIKNAKTEEEVKAIREAAQAEIDKVLTTEEKAQIKAVKGVDKEIFKAKSKYSKLRGKRAIKLTWNVPDGMKFDGFEIYRSTKKFSGYGKTPYFTTTKTSYINSKDLVKGKTYYYKVRAFVIINGEKVYTDYSTKAFRTMK